MNRKRRPPDATLRGVIASVIVERNGAVLRFDNVPADDAPTVLAATLEAFRVLTKTYPELIPGPETVPGGTPIDVADDEWGENGRKRLGF